MKYSSPGGKWRLCSWKNFLQMPCNIPLFKKEHRKNNECTRSHVFTMFFAQRISVSLWIWAPILFDFTKLLVSHVRDFTLFTATNMGTLTPRVQAPGLSTLAPLGLDTPKIGKYPLAQPWPKMLSFFPKTSQCPERLSASSLVVYCWLWTLLVSTPAPRHQLAMTCASVPSSCASAICSNPSSACELAPVECQTDRAIYSSPSLAAQNGICKIRRWTPRLCKKCHRNTNYIFSHTNNTSKSCSNSKDKFKYINILTFHSKEKLKNTCT